VLAALATRVPAAETTVGAAVAVDVGPEMVGPVVGVGGSGVLVLVGGSVLVGGGVSVGSGVYVANGVTVGVGVRLGVGV
jgi:hypothetical protein